VEREKKGNKEENWKVKKEETRAEDTWEARGRTKEERKRKRKRGMGWENSVERRNAIKEGEMKEKKAK
jgi:hypothetical protein